MQGLSAAIWDYTKACSILIATGFVMWVLMIRPYMFDWQPTGEASGQIETLMSNSNFDGAAFIKAVITLENGQQTIVEVPLHSDVRAGSPVVLSVQADTDNPERKRYTYLRTE